MADRYAARSPTRILHYRKLLQNTKKNALSVDDYVLKMKDLAGNLAAAGDNVSETDLVMYILRGLGSDFQPISTILEIRPEQYSLEEVQHHLLAFESKLDELNSAITMMLHIKLQICSNNFSRGRGFNNFLRGRRRNFFGRGGGRSKPTCQLCGVYGHVVAQCYRRFDSTFLGPNVGNTVSEVLHPPTPSNFIGQSFASHPLYSLSAPNFPSKYLDNQATLTSAFSSPSSFIRSQTGTPYYASQTSFPLLASHYPLHSRPTPPLLQFGTLLQVATTTSSYAPSVGPPSRPVSSSLLAQSHMVHSTTTTTAPQNSFPVVVVSDKFAGHCQSASPMTLLDPAWYFDNGATDHVAADGNALLEQIEYRGSSRDCTTQRCA
ncbi:uncharacterized protein LOC125418707 [Ziziphus jujuba]|uniref:Uncharacterized protein LOC125418707 n=1 Tax=Ziziphus jujuba TaxID=326968 RepID=A0ABM3ZX98_ZIZJJ|nr:uncharacterized protein LOC125418707 [Ziziphus jujuba]